MGGNFLGINNDVWMSAARDLSPHALKLYLYFANNANNYEFALSPAHIQEAIGMPRSTYHDQFKVLLAKGYLVQTSGNGFAFFEVPQPRAVQYDVSLMSDAGRDFSSSPATVFPHTDPVQMSAGEDIEIYNKYVPDNDGIDIGDFGAFGDYIPSPEEEYQVEPEWRQDFRF